MRRTRFVLRTVTEVKVLEYEESNVNHLDVLVSQGSVKDNEDLSRTRTRNNEFLEVPDELVSLGRTPYIEKYRVDRVDDNMDMF